jgi:sodium-dependent dicarboxylate transporter 2/3/5
VIRRLALLGGPLALLLTVWLPPPAGLAHDAWRVAGVAAWMALWWLTEAIPLEATALLPLVLLPVLGGESFGKVASSYADPIIFLFLGGFLIAAALERWELHRRFAFATLRLVGARPRRVILAFLVMTAFLSMWISNTATAVMMLPIAAGVAGLERGGTIELAEPKRGFSIALLLAVAYGASIGGVATLIGTPPNALLAANARTLVGYEISFASWLPTGLSITIPLLAASWVILVLLFRVPRAAPGLLNEPAEQSSRPPLGLGEWFVLGVFGLAALAWILREPKELGSLRVPGLSDVVPGLTDSGIAIGAAMLLFAVPLPRAHHRFALDWETARGISWGVLLLFGGGLALAGAAETSGLAGWIGGKLAALGGMPLPLILAFTALLFALLTELTSNTAVAALAMPLLAGVAGPLGVPPIPLMIAGAVACSMAFMLPVATPPNAIVFGYGVLRIRHMLRAGILLDLVAVVVIAVVVSLWAN